MSDLWDRIKSYVNSFSAGVIALLGAIAWYFYSKEKEEEKSNASLQTEAQLASVLSKKEEAKKESQDAEANYNATVAEYRKQSGSGADDK